MRGSVIPFVPCVDVRYTRIERYRSYCYPKPRQSFPFLVLGVVAGACLFTLVGLLPGFRETSLEAANFDDPVVAESPKRVNTTFDVKSGRWL